MRYYPRCSQFRHITTYDIPDMIDHIIGFKKSLDQAIQIQDVMLSNEASVGGFQVTVIFAKNEMQHDQQLQSFEGHAQAMSANGMTAEYILSSSMRCCYDANDIFVNTPSNESKTRAASSAMVQSIQEHPLDHLPKSPKTAGKDVQSIMYLPYPKLE